MKFPPTPREAWNRHWIDCDGDCQDTRAEGLIDDSAVAVSFGLDGRCTVDSGLWNALFTGSMVQFARALDIDHMVPSANAHWPCAWVYSPQNKENYFHYLSFQCHLVGVTLTVIRSSGSNRPEEWQPPNTDYRCEFAIN